ncbi:2-oxo acid dehydrogenase subunit E2 [Aquibacillus sp. 3ASR75-11]|uniref:Dihydrolipoamide acetyltransferase component of pyruvate dehydrogenase complex n=1 Tax=Terrihalobacillus insolitus TaxID=2950438 RepID=A0A9X3WW92_9BACI|nr:dihydrolipoamide acetyltransferase family protein [Terrihalobacillus insolitus]MDC3424574.1 2-oxo acid dehydrogenase subunit E2 [Terrihalobacillus insolitus]
MAKEVFMPKLSSTMQVGTLLQWFKEEGDQVEVGDPLFEIMTDKINIEVEAYEEGVLLKRYFGEDDEVPVNHVIGFIGTEGEDVPDSPQGESGADGVTEDEASSPNEVEEQAQQTEAVSEKKVRESDEKVRATPAARKLAEKEGISLFDVVGSGPNGRVHVEDVNDYLQSAPKATPLAKKVANDKEVDLSTVTGTGANGKIYRTDVEGDLVAPAVEEVDSDRVKLDGVGKVVAKRMVESAFTAPHVTITSEIDMSEVISMRKQLLDKIEKQNGYRLSYTEIIMKAVAHTLKKHQIVNASLQGDEIVMHKDINIGLAVAVGNGLLVPVVKNVDRKGLASLTEECKTLGREARDNKLKPSSMSGGTFTISNLGMYAVDTFTPIINQPESAILGVGRINEKPSGVNGEIKLRPMMTLSLSFDHRIINGAPAAAFLTDLKSVLEQPFELLV